MRNFIKQGKSAKDTDIETKEQLPPAKLYVAFINTTLSNNNGSRYKESVFSTTNGSYYINGIPAILSQDEEAMLADYYECSEYY